MKLLFPGLVVLTLCAGGAAFVLREPSLSEDQVANRPIQDTEAEYASSNACRACHPAQYASWRASYHRTMTQVATPETVVANFDAVTVAHVHGRPMTLERRGREFWATFDDPDARVGSPESSSITTASRAGQMTTRSAAAAPREAGPIPEAGASPAAPNQPPAVSRITRQVVMITGSHHQQVYWYATGRNRLLGQLPAAYLIAEQRWIPRRSAVLHPPSETLFSETGHWNSTCIACHTTNGKPEFETPFGSQPVDTQVVDSRVTEFGIACEACHGPSTGHAAANRSPLRRYTSHLTGRADSTTVLPTRLDPQRSSQVCGQCHGVWEFYDGAGERQANSAGLPYRPGDDLTATRFLAQPTRNLGAPTMQALLAVDPGFVNDSFWSDGMVRVTGREYNGLIESPCFKDAREPARTMTCFSCHSMHQPAGDRRSSSEWADDQLAPGMSDNQACLQCHEPIVKDLTGHTRHEAGSSGSSCYNCHMPFTSYGLLKTIRSHTISSPSVASTIETGRPNACNLCHLDKTLAWTDEYLNTWYGASRVLGADAGRGLSGDVGRGLSDPAPDQEISAALRWALTGDAGQRAIIAQAMAWKPAQAISGTDWMLPHLAQLLDDPYDAVRVIAGRTLRTLPGFATFHYDFAGAPEHRRDAQRRVMSTFAQVRGRLSRPGDPRLLLTPDADVDVPRTLDLLKQRNNRNMLLRE
jgi:hypothetical protein